MAKFFTPSRLSENIVETPEGYLLCMNVPIARTGWQDYGPGETPLEVGEDGKVWVYRDSKDVFKPQTIASFNGKSVTIKHPNDFVAPKNWKLLTHGTAQNTRKGSEPDEDGEEQLLADLLITDELAIGMVKSGLREVSCGYDAEYEQTGDGEGKQFNIIGNHIALVEQGRAGPSYAIKDHKMKGEEMSKFKELAEQLKNLGKTVDASIKADEDAAKAAKLKSKKSKDSKTKDDGETPEQVTFDDVMKAVKDLGEKMDKMGSKDEDKEHIADEDKENDKDDAEDEDMEDSDEDQESNQNSRLEKIEACLSRILKMLGNKGEDEDKEDDKDMSGDEDSEAEDEDESEAEDEEAEEGEESQKKKTGDEAKIEILTPGKKFKGKDARQNCLKEFAKTEDGKKVLVQLGMKKPVFDSKTDTNMIFMAASALMKSKRGTGLSGTKDGTKFKDGDENTSGVEMTADKLNEINAKHYGSAK